MKQYCRYCQYAIDYNGEATDFICWAKAKCGFDGAGRAYPASKAKRPNKCRSFAFNPLDVFWTSYGERYYKPRGENEDYKEEQCEVSDRDYAHGRDKDNNTPAESV